MTRVIRTALRCVVWVALVLGASLGLAQDMEQVKVVFEHAIPNIQNKKMVSVLVTYPPGAKSLPHHHAPSSFVYAYVVSGAIRTKVGEEPTKIYNAGESFYEAPGSFHRISENASDKDPATLLAVFIVDLKDAPLTIPDQK
jgi:quercetin dioxygenase-like cupin family protein